MARLGELLERVRAAPITGATKDADGSALQVRVDPRALADMVQDTASDPLTLRELDASVRAALAGDDVPLLRLAGQAGTWNHSPSDADYFSRGAYLAVNCTDLPQLFDIDATPQRGARSSPRRRAGRRLRALHRRGMADDQRLLAALRRLPGLAEAAQAPAAPAARELPAGVPILIVGGDLDSLTPLLDAPGFGPELGEDVDDRAAAQHRPRDLAGRRLPRRGHALRADGDPLVPARDAGQRVRGDDPRAAHAGLPTLATPPATLVSGPDPGETARRAATVAVQAFADAVVPPLLLRRRPRPGPARRHVHAPRATSHAARRPLRPDVTVSGTGRWDASTGGARVDADGRRRDG